MTANKPAPNQELSQVSVNDLTNSFHAGMYYIDFVGKGIESAFIINWDKATQEITVLVMDPEVREIKYNISAINGIYKLNKKHGERAPKYFVAYNIPYTELDLSQLEKLQPGKYWVQLKEMGSSASEMLIVRTSKDTITASLPHYSSRSKSMFAKYEDATFHVDQIEAIYTTEAPTHKG